MTNEAENCLANHASKLLLEEQAEATRALESLVQAIAIERLAKPQEMAAEYTTRTNRNERQSVTSKKAEPTYHCGIQIT